MSTGIEVEPRRVEATPGTPVRLVATVRNDDSDPRAHRVRIVGSDSSWSGEARLTPVLAPGQSASLEFDLRLPLGFPGGEHLFGVEAVPLGADGTPMPGRGQVADVVVVIGSLQGLHGVMEPQNVDGSRRARTTISLRNRSNTPLRVELDHDSPGGDVGVRFDRDDVVIPPGHVVPIRAKLRSPRNLRGQPRRIPFTVTASGGGQQVHLDGTYQQQPMLRSGVMKALAIIAVLAVWASTLSYVFERVSADGDQEQASGEQAGSDGEDGGGADGSGNGSGSDGSGSGSGADAGSVDASGKVTAREPQGVEVRLRAVSLVEEVDQAASGSGRLTSASPGVKLFGRRGGVLFNRVVPEERTTATDRDGRWGFSGVTGPGFYELRFSKPGFQTAAYIVEVSEEGDPITLDTELVAGDGGMSGTITDQAGRPLGGVDITVTDGVVTLTARTATTGNVGSWTVEGLDTPGSYLVSASRRGFGTGTALVSLSGGQFRTGVDIRLQSGVGTILGTVNSPLGPLGGITVTAVDGDLVRTTSTLTEGPVGTFALPQLPVPGTYTLTVEGDGWLTQTRDVHLTGDEARVDIDMVASTAVIYGRLTDAADGSAIGGAGITATSDSNVFKNTTAPDGTYELAGLPPGTYVIEFERFEFEPGSALVTVGAGGLREVDVALTRRTQLDPTPNNSLSVSFSAEGVPPSDIYVTVTDRESGQSADTDGGGLAQLTNLPPGIRTLDVERTPGAPPNAAGLQGTSVTVQMALNGAQSVSVALKPLVSVDLRVQDVNGAAIEGAHVLIERWSPCPPSGCLVYDGFTSPNGTADPAPGVADGYYTVTVSHDGYRGATTYFFADVETRPTEPVTVRLDRLGAMEFDIVEPQGSSSFVALDDVDITLTATSVCAVSTMSATTDDHPYLFEAIEPCTWTATLSKTGYRTVTLTGITTSLNQTTPVSAVMVAQPGVTTGTLEWEPGGGEPARPIEGATVVVNGVAGYNRTANGLTQIPGTWVDVTDASGVFSFPAESGPVEDAATFTVTHPTFDTLTFAATGGTDVGTRTMNPLPGSIGGTFVLVEGGVVGGVDPFQVDVTIVESPNGALDGAEPDALVGSGIVGSYSFASVPAGRYVIRGEYAPGGFTPAEVTVIVDPAASATAPQIVLEEQGSVSVTVREVLDPAPGASPVGTLDGATVGLRDADGNAVPGVSDVTLAAGVTTTSFGDLDAGDYLVVAERDGYVLREPAGVTVGIGTDSPVDVVLRKLTWVTGVLMGDRGGSSNVPLAGVDVVITQDGVDHEATTDSNGMFRIDSLEGGTAELSADPEDYESITVTFADSTGDEASLQSGETRDLGTIVTDVLRGSIAGRVVSTSGGDDPPDGLTVVLMQGNDVVTATSFDADTGEFSYTNLLPGAYELTVSAPNHLTQSQPINVQAGVDTDLGDINLTFARSSVDGEVVLRVGSTFLPDSEMAGTTVELVNVADDSSVSTTTTSGGLYSFDDVDDGTYRVRASRAGYDTVLSNTVTLDEGRVVPIGQLTLNALTRNVTVTVTSAVGDTPLVGASVSLTPTEFSTGIAPAGSVTTVAGGVATFNSLVPGGYTATVNGAPIGHRNGSTTFTLDVSASPTTAFAVEIQEARVHGTISIEDTNPDPDVVTTPNGVTVSVHDGSGTSLATTTITGATGATATFQLWVPATAREVRASVTNYFTEVLPLVATEVEAGDTKDLGTIAMVPTGSFTITVTDAVETDEPVSGASVWYRRGSSGAFVEASGTTAADGTLTVSGLRTSTSYEWYATADDYLDSAPASITPTVSGAAGSAALTPTGSARISVTGGSGGWSVTLTHTVTNETFDDSSANGSSITFDDLPTGTYAVAATRGAAGWEGSGSVDVPHGDTGTTTITVSNPNP